MWIIIAAIIIFIIFADSDTKPSANKKGNTKTDSRLHCTVNRTGSYSSILNELEQIVFLIAKRCPWMKLHVLVMVSKINASTCSVSFQIEDVSLKRNNITFGSEFQDKGDGSYECILITSKESRQQALQHRKLSSEKCFASLTGRISQPISQSCMCLIMVISPVHQWLHYALKPSTETKYAPKKAAIGQPFLL